MKAPSAFTAFVVDQLDGLGDLLPRSMFGGVGLYCDGVFFGIIADDTLYLKVNADNRPDYEQAGITPFTPYADRPTTMHYYAVPVGVLETASELVAWARKAVAAAATSPRRRTRPGRRRSSAPT